MLIILLIRVFSVECWTSVDIKLTYYYYYAAIN